MSHSASLPQTNKILAHSSCQGCAQELFLPQGAPIKSPERAVNQDLSCENTQAQTATVNHNVSISMSKNESSSCLSSCQATTQNETKAAQTCNQTEPTALVETASDSSAASMDSLVSQTAEIDSSSSPVDSDNYTSATEPHFLDELNVDYSNSSSSQPLQLARGDKITPFFEFSAQTWSTFAHNKDCVNLTEEDLQRCLAFNDKISLQDVYNIYLPLSRLLYLYVRSRHDRSTVIQQFLGKSIESSPFIISISGSVACGKTTTANLLKHLISSWDTNPKVDLITTDGFLYPNDVLKKRHIQAKKGFPISYDVKALMTFLHKLKNGEPNLKVPVYSHLYYDVMPGEFITVDRPDILILEGVNVLQNGADYPTIRNKVFISDFIDFSIYVDAEEENLIEWYLERFLKLRESTFNNPDSYFHRYAEMSRDTAINMATTIWSAVNHDNLVENIMPSRNRANLILHKVADHSIDRIYLRK